MIVEVTASRTLIVLGLDTSDILSLVLRMALTARGRSAAAVLQSVFALAALHRDGPNEQSSRLKIEALHALASSVTGDITSIAVAQHVVCGLLLCIYEMQKNSDTSYQWLWYICGAKHLIKTQNLDAPGRNGDFDLLVGWAQYYEVMARFGLRHWRRRGTAEFAFAEYLGYHAAMPSIIAELTNPPIALLDLLREVIDVAEATTSLRSSSSGYSEYALNIESRLHETRRILLEQQPGSLEDQNAITEWRIDESRRPTG
ncbi:hypothetical protein V2A60_009808 [Cordyceps javanica]|nr:fungal specific transcription factor domain-containing protein [Cordyceps javanica]